MKITIIESELTDEYGDKTGEIEFMVEVSDGKTSLCLTPPNSTEDGALEQVRLLKKITRYTKVCREKVN